MYRVTDTKKTETELLVSVSLAHKDWDAEIGRQTAAAAKRVSLPGFRKGKVPLAKARERIDMLDVANKAINALLPKLYPLVQKEKAVDGDDDVIALNPDVELKGLDPTPTFAFRFDLVPDVELPDYKKIPGVAAAQKPTAADADREVKGLCRGDATFAPKTGKAAAGDVCVIDFSGEMGGKAVPGAQGTGYELELGSGSFIPGFEDGLLGAGAGDERKLDLKFPEKYHAADLAGKPVSFKVSVKAVKSAKYPELTPEYVKSLLPKIGNPDGVRDERTLRAFVERKLAERDAAQAKSAGEAAIRAYLCEKAKFAFVPRRLVAEHARRIREQFEQQVARLRLTVEDALRMQGTSEEVFAANLEREAEANVKYAVVADKIAELEGIECSDADLAAKVAEVVSQQPRAARDAQFRKTLEDNLRAQADYLRELVVNDKLTDLLYKANAK